jgi:hypothetical protein
MTTNKCEQKTKVSINGHTVGRCMAGGMLVLEH